MSLTVESAADAARAAAAAAGRPQQQLEVLRVGSAIVFAGQGLVLRVTGPEVPRAEVQMHLRLAAYLHEHGVLAAIPELAEPVCLGGLVATVWRRDEVLDERPDPARVGRLLAATHRLAVPAWLPALDVLAVTRRRLDTFAGGGTQVTPKELKLMQVALHSCQALLSERLDPAATQIVHGDIPGNVMCTPRGHVLIDFENAGAGDCAWDLARLIHGPARFAGRSSVELDVLLDAYRADGGPGDVVLARALLTVIDLIGAAWTVAGRAMAQPMVAESQVRLAWLRDPEHAPPWHAL